MLVRDFEVGRIISVRLNTRKKRVKSKRSIMGLIVSKRQQKYLLSGFHSFGGGTEVTDIEQ